jgi:Domain of unknown function (DUF4920)
MLKKITLVSIAFVFAMVGTFAQKQYFGAKIKTKNAISYDELLPKMEAMTAQSKELETKVKGVVKGVCQAKGCWMTIKPSDPSKPALLVKFKDYAFFMPKDCAGKEVVFEGKAFIEETPVEELRHYAEDAGKSAEEIAKITEPKREYKFMASGVALLNK